MTQRDNAHGIGEVLIDMGLLSADEMRKLLATHDSQANCDFDPGDVCEGPENCVWIDALLSKLVVSKGIVSESQLAVARVAQADLRRDNKLARAMGQAAVAEVSCATVIHIADRIRSKSATVRRIATGTEHSAVTTDMLAAKE